jgi:hypothetical protein
MLPQTTSAAHQEAPLALASTYSFAQSSLSGGGFENVIAADPRHNGVVLSGSDVGGIDRSTDFGKTWLAAQGGLLNQVGNPIASIVFDPKSPNDVYAATDSGVGESTNDGVSWTPLTTGPTFNGSDNSSPTGIQGPERCVGNLLAVDDSTSPARIFAASYDQGVWMYNATSGGMYSGTWSPVATEAALGGAGCLTSLAWGPDGALDVSTWNGTAGVYTISDPSAASPAVAVPGAPPTVQELVGLSDGHVWGAAYGSGVGEITGGSWVIHTPPGDGPGQNYMSIAGYVIGGADVVIAGSDYSPQYDVLHETSNSGSTWTSLPSPTAPDNVSTDLLGGSVNPWWHGSYQPALLYSSTMVPSSIAIEHEKKGDDVWIAGYGGNWRLLGAEGQTTFYPSDYGIGSTVNHQLALDPTTIGDPGSSQRVYLGDTDWGMFSSADGFSTQQGISDDQVTTTGDGTDVLDTVADGGASSTVVYLGVGNRNTNNQGDLLSAAAPATSSTDFEPTGLATATGGLRPLAVGVVDTSGTTTLLVAVENSGMWSQAGSLPWVQDTSLFTSDPTNTPTGAIAVGSGTQADTVYAYDPKVGVYRSLDAGALDSWTKIWSNPSVATAPFLMVDSANPTTLWVSAAGGLYKLDNASTATLGTYAGISPVIAGNETGLPELSGLAELNGQVLTTELGPGTGLEVLASDPTGTTFTNLSNSELSDTQAVASSIAIANDGTIYIGTSGEGVIVGTPIDQTATSIESSANPAALHAPVTFTATVTALDIGDTPGGAVVFWNGNKKLGTGTLVDGNATFTTKKLKKGSYSIVAKYQGAPSDDPSDSTPLPQVIS